MPTHSQTFHQEVQSLRGTVTVDLWTFLYDKSLTHRKNSLFYLTYIVQLQRKINIIIIIIIIISEEPEQIETEVFYNFVTVTL